MNRSPPRSVSCCSSGSPRRHLATAQSPDVRLGGHMTTARSGHSATLLPQRASAHPGGASPSSGILASAKSQIQTPALSLRRTMMTARREHTATSLRTTNSAGRVTVMAARWRAPSSSTRPRHVQSDGQLEYGEGWPTAILSNGQGLVIGGYGVVTYPDIAPLNSTIRPREHSAPRPPISAGRGAFAPHRLCLLTAPSCFRSVPAQLYDPTSDSSVRAMMKRAVRAVALTNGKVLFAGVRIRRSVASANCTTL